MPFVKGQSGNPGGRPKVDPEVQALLEKLTPDAVRTLGEIMRNSEAQPSARVTAALGLLRKTLPDLTATEHKGDGLQPFVIFAPVPDETETWEQKYSH